VYLNTGHFIAPDGVYFTGDYTIAAWVNVRAFNHWSRIIDFGNGPDSNNVIFGVTQMTYSFFSSTLVKKPFTQVSVSIWNKGNLISYNTELQLNVWTHLAITNSNGACKLHINGMLELTDWCLIPNAVTRTNCYVGKSNYNGDDQDLDGYLDEDIQ
jgi:hypothetical protein